MLGHRRYSHLCVAIVLVGACGRVSFDPLGSDALVVVDDGGSLVIHIDPGPRHLGNSSIAGGVPADAEGSGLTVPFAVPVQCTTASLEVTFVPPNGPNVAEPPHVEINSALLGSVLPFFHNCGTDCDDFTAGDVHVTLPATGIVVLGSNSFTIACGTANDDFFFRDVVLRCTR